MDKNNLNKNKSNSKISAGFNSSAKNYGGLIKKGVRKMTIFDVAEFAGVSIATVSRVINGNKRVKEETRQKVREVIKELDFTPDPRAQELGGIKGTKVDTFDGAKLRP